MKRRYNGTAIAGSKIFGYNFGKYPKHNFFTPNTSDVVFPIYPKSAGNDIWHCECFRQRINSDIFALEYVVEGVFIFNQNGTDYRCVPGDVFLLHLGSDSSMRCETPTAAKKVITLAGSMLQTLIAATGLDRVVVLSLKDSSRFDELFEKLIGEITRETPDSLLVSSLSYSILLALAEQLVIAPRPPELKKALQFIQGSLNGNLSLADLASHSGVSKATLYRLFREHLNCSPINFFIQQKLIKAQQLLEYYPVKQVASMLNYPSTQYFSTEFKKHFGVSPRKYKSGTVAGNNNHLTSAENGDAGNPSLL